MTDCCPRLVCCQKRRQAFITPTTMNQGRIGFEMKASVMPFNYRYICFVDRQRFGAFVTKLGYFNVRIDDFGFPLAVNSLALQDLATEITQRKLRFACAKNPWKFFFHSRRLRWKDLWKEECRTWSAFGSLKSVTQPRARSIISDHPPTPSSPYGLSTPTENPHRVNNFTSVVMPSLVPGFGLDPISKHRDIARSLSFEIKSVEWRSSVWSRLIRTISHQKINCYKMLTKQN